MTFNFPRVLEKERNLSAWLTLCPMDFQPWGAPATVLVTETEGEPCWLLSFWDKRIATSWGESVFHSFLHSSNPELWYKSWNWEIHLAIWKQQWNKPETNTVWSHLNVESTKPELTETRQSGGCQRWSGERLGSAQGGWMKVVKRHKLGGESSNCENEVN